MTTTTDQQSILDALAAADRPADMFEIVHTVAPPPTDVDGHSREVRQWRTRAADLLRDFVRLWEAGLIVEIVEPHGHRYQLGEQTCRVCGCTDEACCEFGCWWVALGLCSDCQLPLEDSK